jgi:CRP/FNR family transcriptional regulator
MDLPNTRLLEGVEPSVIQSLLSRAQARTCRARELVIREHQSGYGLLFVLSGSINAFFSTAAGGQLMVRIVRGPDVVLNLCGGPSAELAQALEDTHVVVVARADLERALEQSHRLTRNALQCAAVQLATYGHSLRTVAFNDVEGRLAQLLLDCCRLYGEPSDEGTRIDIPLTQESLADMLGVARRSVTRAFQRWMRLGVLKKREGRFVVDEDQLTPSWA